MDLSINFDFFLIFQIYTQIHTQKLNIFFLKFKLPYSKLAARSPNPNPYTKKIENPNPNLSLWVFCLIKSD